MYTATLNNVDCLDEIAKTIDKVSVSSAVPALETLDNLLQLCSLDPSLFKDTSDKIEQLPGSLKERFVQLFLNYQSEINSPPTSLRAGVTVRTPEGKLDLGLRSLQKSFADYLTMRETYYDESNAIALLNSHQSGVDRTLLITRIKEGSLLGILDGQQYRFPKWQFDPDRQDGIVKGMQQVVNNLNCWDEGKISWFLVFNLDLGGATPLDLLKAGEIERVVEAAKKVGTGMQ
jgi:hypothetical protein